jgi:hypothetical protein
MERLPDYISVFFVCTTLLTIFFLYKASNHSKPLIIGVVSWLVLQSAISLTKFYTIVDRMPPRFVLLLFPTLLLIVILFVSKKGRSFIDDFDISVLTLLHIVRVPVEFTLYWLYQHQLVPEIMTFEGRNLDILSGLTAPFFYYFGYHRKVLGKKTLLIWNIVCLLLLLNIVATALMSLPTPFQRFAFDQPNIALLYFPFVWLPCCIVPIVLFAHLAAIRQLIKKT